MSEKCYWLYFLFKIDTMISEMVMQASNIKGVVIPYLLKHQLKSAKACIHKLLAIGLSSLEVIGSEFSLPQLSADLVAS
jgi:hypothetical protein